MSRLFGPPCSVPVETACFCFLCVMVKLRRLWIGPQGPGNPDTSPVDWHQALVGKHATLTMAHIMCYFMSFYHNSDSSEASKSILCTTWTNVSRLKSSQMEHMFPLGSTMLLDQFYDRFHIWQIFTEPKTSSKSGIVSLILPILKGQLKWAKLGRQRVQKSFAGHIPLWTMDGFCSAMFCPYKGIRLDFPQMAPRTLFSTTSTAPVIS